MDGYYLNASDVCTDCTGDDSNCSECDSELDDDDELVITCTECSGDYILEDGNCDNECAENCVAGECDL
jgi:hypothetical protein